MAAFLKIDEPAPGRSAEGGFALWRLGFRPFYLLAAGFACLSVVSWAMQIAGLLPGTYLPGPLWHAHEMVFGFTAAIIVGFLFTAVRNWADRPTPTGALLAALVLLWVAGRVAVLSPWPWLAAVVNVAFPLAAALGIGVPLVRADNRRNFFFIGVLVLLGVAQLAFHLAQMNVLDLPQWVGIRVALDLVLFVMAVMAGRVIPMFTNNGVRGATARRDPRIEKAALGSVIALVVADALQVPAVLLVPVLLVCAASHLARLALWAPARTLRVPLVWVLHAAYLWIPVHLLLRAAGETGWLAGTFATHALTIGAIGGLTIGMMTRTARGHTGRPLKADRCEVACYALVLSAGVVRVFVPMVLPSLYMASVLAAGLLWASGYGLYAVRYWPVLTRPRLDGKPG